MPPPSDPSQPANAALPRPAIERTLEALQERCGQSLVPYMVQVARDEGGTFGMKFTAELPPVDEWQKPADLPSHQFSSLAGFIAYVAKYGTPDKTVIFYNQERVVAVLDESKDRGDRAEVSYAFAYSEEFAAWRDALGRPTPHNVLRDWLAFVSHTLLTPELVAAMQAIKYSEEVVYDSDVNTDEGRAAFSVAFKVQGANDSVRKIPKSTRITLPVLAEDLLSPEKYITVPIRLELQMPKAPKQPLGVLLFSPELKLERARRIDAAMADMRAALDGNGEKHWLIVAGSPEYSEVEIGNKERYRAFEPAKR